MRIISVLVARRTEPGVLLAAVSAFVATLASAVRVAVAGVVPRLRRKTLCRTGRGIAEARTPRGDAGTGGIRAGSGAPGRGAETAGKPSAQEDEAMAETILMVEHGLLRGGLETQGVGSGEEAPEALRGVLRKNARGAHCRGLSAGIGSSGPRVVATQAVP